MSLLVSRLTPSLTISTVLATRLPANGPHRSAASTAAVGADWNIVRKESLAELRVSPVAEDAWLRLAQVDAAVRGGKLGPNGLDALSHAYDAEPYELGSSRIRRDFVRRHLDELTGDLRSQVEQESNVAADSARQGERASLP